MSSKTLFFFGLALVVGCGPKSGAAVAEEYCACTKSLPDVSPDRRVNHFTKQKICEGRLIEKYPLYRVFAVDMVYADTARQVDWAERERSRLFMNDFSQYMQANCKEFF